MNSKTATIEVDKATAEALEHRAAERGISVADLVAEVARASGPVSIDSDEIADLDRRWAKAAAGETIRHADVVRWLDTWGTPEFKPWREQ